MDSPRIRPVPAEAWLAGLLAFAVYAAGASRTIYVGDSGELVAAAHTLGIPHPSGYPLYVLLGKLWMLLVPAGSIAFRMSLFSAACAAAACGLLVRACRRLGASPCAAAAAGLLLAFSPSFWGEANIQRVYALNALALAAATTAAVEWHLTRRDHWLVLAFFLAALGAANHTFMGVFALGLGLFAIGAEPALLRSLRRLAACAGAVAAGLLPYLYLPLRSLADPPLDWGDPETPERFLAVVLRRDFWPRAWMSSPADFARIVIDYLSSLGAELFWVGAVLALVGAFVGWRRGVPVPLFLLTLAGNLLAVAFHGSRKDIFVWHRYYIPSYFMAALLAGLGIQWMIERWPRRAAAAVLLLPLALLVTGYPRMDRSRYRIAEDFSRRLLASLPPRAHLAASDDNVLFVLMYLKMVEGVRPDVSLLLEGVGDAALPPLRFDPDTEPLLFTHPPAWSEPAVRLLPTGFAYRVARAGTPPLPPPPAGLELAGETDPRVPKDDLTRGLLGHFHLVRAAAWEGIDRAETLAELSRAAAAAPDNEVLFYNLGLAYRRLGMLDEALAAFSRSLAIDPRPIAGRARALDRIVEVLRERGDQRLALPREILRHGR